MKYKIELIDGKHYVFGYDRYGNKFDTMRHFATKEKAQQFIKSYR